MRSSTRRALTFGALGACAIAWSGCEAKKQTEYVAGVSTQVQVPRDLKAIRIDVSVGGVVQFCRGYRVYDGKVQLPRSLGQFPSQGKPGADPITVTVSGFTEEFSESTGNPVFDNCTSVAPKVGDKSGTRILRRSRQPYVLDEVLFLPMPLKYSCFDQAGCDDENKTCKGGRCVDSKTDETKLPKFSEDLIDGTGGNCFPASLCFAAGAPAVSVNPDDCTYALPNSPPSSPPVVEGAPPNQFPRSGDGINVEVTYDGGLTREILDKEELEGFTIPDPAGKPQQFRLAPGLCDLVKGFGPPDAANPDGVPTPHRITAIRVSGTCRAKGPFQPLCAADQLAAMGADPSGVAGESNPPSACKPIELKPPKSVLMLVADNTKKSQLFFDQAPGQTVGVPLSDPAFQTAEIGLQFFPGPVTASCPMPGSFTPAVEPALARGAKVKIRDAFSAAAPALRDDPANLDGALRDAYTMLGDAKYAGHFRRAVLVLGNHDFDLATCSGQTPVQRATTAKAVNKIETYVLMLARDQTAGAPDPSAAANALAEAGGTTKVYDARASKTVAQEAFQTIVNDIATCVYDVADPALRPKMGDTLSYTDPVNPSAPTVSLSFNGACSVEQAGGSGFGVDATNPNRVYLCQASCEAYRSVLKNASFYAALYLMPAIAVPVFSHPTGCAPKLGGKGTGSVP